MASETIHHNTGGACSSRAQAGLQGNAPPAGCMRRSCLPPLPSPAAAGNGEHGPEGSNEWERIISMVRRGGGALGAFGAAQGGFAWGALVPSRVLGAHQCNPGCMGCCRVGPQQVVHIGCWLGEPGAGAAAPSTLRCVPLHPTPCPARSTSTWPAPTAAVRVFVLALLPRCEQRRRACYGWSQQAGSAAGGMPWLLATPRCAAAHPCPVPPQTCRASRACCSPPSPRVACRRRLEGWRHGQLGWAAHGMTARAP